MNNGLIRSMRILLYKTYINFYSYLFLAIVICIFIKANFNENNISALMGGISGAFSGIVFALPRQHKHVIKTIRYFGITRKNYSLSYNIICIISSLLSLAMLWIILSFAGVFKFTPLISVIVFFLMIFIDLFGEFNGLLLCKGKNKTSFVISFTIYLIIIVIPVFTLFSNVGIIHIDTFLWILLLISVTLSLSFFIINSLFSKNLELTN